MHAVQHNNVEKRLFGMLKKKQYPLWLIDNKGVIRLQKSPAWITETTVENWQAKITTRMTELTKYDDGGKNLPNIYLVLGKKVIDLSGLQEEDQVVNIGNMELSFANPEEKIIFICTNRVDN